MQIFQGKSECLLEQKVKGEGSEAKCCKERKEEDAGESGVHKKCQKKILFSSSQAFFFYKTYFGKFVFKLWLMFSFFTLIFRSL